MRTQSSLLACALSAAVLAAPAGVSAQTDAGGEAGSRRHELRSNLGAIPRLHVTTLGRVITDETGGGGLRGPGGCPQTVASNTDANFSGGSFIVEAGMVQNEIAAASYVLPASAFPIKIDLMEFIVATSNASQQVELHYSILVWDGPPNTGTLVRTEMATDQPGELPYARVGPGTAGVNIQVQIDPGDPNQIFINDAGGTHTFSIGIRIDPPSDAGNCFQSAPTCCSAWPTVDTSGLQNPARNWLNGLNCGSLGCPSGGGWATFQALPSFCRPSGDWVMRATWESVNCSPVVGSCCTAGNCTITDQTSCVNGGGSYRGDNTTCANPCPPPPTGGCCASSGACTVVTQTVCASGGGIYRGDGTNCSTPCPQPSGACCFGSNSCLFLTQSDCAQIPGQWQGAFVQCGANNQCPSGACCLTNGNCISTSGTGCATVGGTFHGFGIACAGANCPQPSGACCTSSGGCLVLTQSDCSLIGGATWHGAGTTCPGGCAPACRPDWDQNGHLEPADIASFVNSWFASLQNGTLVGDYDGNGHVEPSDIGAFVNDWFARLSAGGC